MVINDLNALLEAKTKIEHLLENGDTIEAFDFADNLCAGSGQESLVRNLRACTYADVGEQNNQTSLIEEAIQIWRSAGDDITTPESYNLAHSMLSIWNLHERQHGFANTWLEKRDYLHGSRRILAAIANDEEADSEFRLKALTDAGNSYDNVGRRTDAIGCYDQALSIDSSFAMARGNRGLAFLYGRTFHEGF